MTHQEAIWKGKLVWVTGILSKSGKLHRAYRKYVGRGGWVLGDAKNGMLLIQFKGHTRAIPAGCVAEYGTVKSAKSGGKIGTN